ncbi:MAG: deoxyribonuclease IV [Desulfohalobiaceae bacterium]
MGLKPKDSPYLGAHCSATGGLYRAIERIQALEGTALQLFTRNQRQWNPKPLQEKEVADFQQAWQDWGDYPILAHDSYLINLASPEKEIREKSIQAFALELERCGRLGIPRLVSHPGSYKQQSREQGLGSYVQALEESLRRASRSCPESGQVTVLLETTSGQGTSLGGSFQDLAQIIQACSSRERLAVCLDTCHVFAAGYELRSRAGFDQTLQELERTIGLDLLQALHLNDSKNDLGSHGDRHQHIGQGKLGLEPFRMILNELRLTGIPMLLETPKDKAGMWDRENLAVLHGLINPRV